MTANQTNAAKTKIKTAYAKAVSGCGRGAVYQVSYSDNAGQDSNVSYGYLQVLARHGYCVEVDGAGDIAPHIIAEIGGKLTGLL